MILSWILASLLWAVYASRSVSGEGGLESCGATAGHTAAEPIESTGTALAQIKMNAAKPVYPLEELRKAAEPVGDPSDDGALGPQPQQARGNDPNDSSSQQQNKIQEGLEGMLQSKTSEQLATLEPEEESEETSEQSVKPEMVNELVERNPHHPHHNSDDKHDKHDKHDKNDKSESKHHRHHWKPFREIPVPGADVYEYREELDEPKLAQHVVIPIAAALVLSLFIGNVLHFCHLDFLPESLVTLALGCCLGSYMRYTIGTISLFTEEEVFNECMSTVLTLFLLPILIFQAGWTLRKRDFASQFEYIMLYAIIGTLLSFTVVGLLIWLTGRYGYHNIRYPRAAFAYASLIAATDPVATLSTYASLKVDPLLNILVFGDSTFNDAVAIVLFKVLNSNEIMGVPGRRPELGDFCGNIALGIVKIFFCSAGLGILCALFFLLGLRIFQMNNSPATLIIALTAMAYVTFAAGEVLELSGIIATVFCSLILGIYARYHLTDAGAMLSDFWLNQLGCIMDHLVFFLTGFCVVFMGTTDNSGWIFGLWAMLFCLIGRAFAVYPMSWIANCCKRRAGRLEGKPEESWHVVSPGMMFMMWHASLRGAISLTLCMQLGIWVDDSCGLGTRKTLQTGTFLLICVFLVVFGGSTDFFLKRLHIPMGMDAPRERLYESEVSGRVKQALVRFNDNVMMPAFVGQHSTYHRSNKTLDAQEMLQHCMRRKYY